MLTSLIPKSTALNLSAVNVVDVKLFCDYKKKKKCCHKKQMLYRKQDNAVY